jgi:hypothetical protein
MPTASEVGCIHIDNDYDRPSKRDIIVKTTDNHIKHVDQHHKDYAPLAYVLLLPYGSPGWYVDYVIPDANVKVTLKQFTSCNLMERDIKTFPRNNPIDLGGGCSNSTWLTNALKSFQITSTTSQKPKNIKYGHVLQCSGNYNC